MTESASAKKVRGPQVLTESPPELIREPDASPLSRLKSSAWAVGAAARFRTAAAEGLSSDEGRLVRRHPFFHLTSRNFKEQAAGYLEPFSFAEVQVASEEWEEELWEALGRPPPLAKAMVLVRQGDAIPWNLKGLIMGDASCGLQVLYHGTVLTPELNETFLPSLAGQEVALGLVDESPFTVQLKGEAEGIYFLSLEKLHELRDGYPDDYSTLLLRARRVLTAVLGSWVQRFYVRCFPRLFSYVTQEFMAALVSIISVKVVRGGEKICREGEPGNFGFYLHSGRAVAQRGKANIIRLSSDKRSWHSWWGMLEVGGTCVEQTCTVIAEMDCVIWVLQSKHAEELRVNFPHECGRLDRISTRHLQLLSPHMDAMRGIAMFADCGKEFQEMLNSEFAQRICARDEVIIRESEVGEEMFVLALGKCQVLRSGNEQPVSRLHPGSVFGGLAVLGISQTRKETVVADTVCDLRALSRKALLRVLERFPEEEERILAIVEAHSQSRKAASTALEQASAGEGGFSQDFIRMLVDNMFEQPYMVNQAILVQGTPGTHLVVLVHGIVEIEANGMVVATVGAPGIFGERGLLVSGSRSGATVRCTTVAECMMLPVDGPSTPVIRQLYEQDMKKMELMLQKKMASTVQTLSSEGQDLPSQQPTSFLKNCDPSFLTRMAQHLEKQVFLPGQTLLEEGSDAGFSLLIQQGSASIEKGGRHVGQIGSGEFIGESVALGFVPTATATVRADERMLTFAINNTAFRELMSEFPEEKSRLLELVQKRQEAPQRRPSGKLFNQVVAVNAMRELRESVLHTPEVLEAPARPLRRLPGYRSGMDWVRQRHALLKEAVYVKMERVERSPKSGSVVPRRELPALSRVPDMPAWHPVPQAVPKSQLRLKKSQRVYGRKVWLETCPGRPRPPETAAEALTVAQDEPGHLPNVEEAAEERPASGGSQRSGSLSMSLPLELARHGETPLSSPSAKSEDTPKGLSQQLSKWFASAAGQEVNPIEQLARFLQKEEALEEHEQQAIRRELLERAFQGFMLLCEEPREEVDSEGSDDSEGALWRPLDMEIGRRVNTMVMDALKNS